MNTSSTASLRPVDPASISLLHVAHRLKIDLVELWELVRGENGKPALGAGLSVLGDQFYHATIHESDVTELVHRVQDYRKSTRRARTYYAAGVLAISIGNVLLKGFVLSILWSWFVVTTFNITPLSIPAAIGISAVFSLFLNRFEVQKIKPSPERDLRYEWKDLLKSLAYNTLGIQLTGLLFGWMVYQFM